MHGASFMAGVVAAFWLLEALFGYVGLSQHTAWVLSVARPFPVPFTL
jgi:hypothetical protein